MAIEVHNVTKRFDEFIALDDVSVTVQDGALMALLGPAAAASRRLLRIIAGLETPDKGSVSIGGQDSTHSARAHAGSGLRLPALRPVQAHDCL